jgi:hypothetical protein
MAAGFETDAALSLSGKGLLAPSFPKDRHNRSPGMNLNSDFSARAAVHAARLDWTPSPIPGVDRRMLDRIGDEVARATSIVRYAPHSRFAAHTHGGGGEFLVLDGVFQDEHGDYLAGTYVRNPHTSSHTPGSEPGCTIFVKLWQFDPDDRMPVRIDTSAVPFAPAPDLRGLEFAPLYKSARELGLLERWAPGITVAVSLPGGIELLVLDGSFIEGGEEFTRLSWLRLPAGATLQATAGRGGCEVWVKSGHHAPRLPAAASPVLPSTPPVTNKGACWSSQRTHPWRRRIRTYSRVPTGWSGGMR